MSIVLLLLVILALRLVGARGKRTRLARQTYQSLAIQAWEPTAEADDQAETAPDGRPPEDACRIATTPSAKRAPLAGFYRTLYGPGLCSPQGKDITTTR